MLETVNKDPKELTFDDFTNFMAEYSYKPNGEQKVSSCLIMQYHALKCYSTYLFEAGVISKNYMESIKRPKAITSQKTLEKREKSFLTPTEIKVYLDAVKNGVGSSNARKRQMRERDYAIIVIFLTTGIRKSALIKLDVDNVDFENRVLWVTDKGSKVHPYILGDEAIEALKAWLKKRHEALKGNETNALFVTQYGLRMQRYAIEDVVNKYAIDIKGKNITPHKLRATYGTQLYNKTKDIYFVQQAMGHSSPTTTERYVRGQNNVTRQAADIMGKLL
jgi:integrase